MKTRLTIGISLCVLTTLAAFYFQNRKPEPSTQFKIPGSFSSLDSMTRARDSGLPVEGRFMEAWKKSQRMGKAGSAQDIAPWEAIGPIDQGARTLALAIHPNDPNLVWLVRQVVDCGRRRMAVLVTLHGSALISTIPFWV